MAETSWNTKTAISIAKYLNRHKPSGATVITEFASSGTSEVRVLLTHDSVKPEIVIYVFGCIDLFVDMSSRTAHKRCWYTHQAIETLKELLPDILEKKANGHT